METLFSKIIHKEIPADVVYEDDLVLAFLDINPVRKGHTLIIPKKHFENILDGDPEILGHMMVVAQKISRALVKSLGAQGINIRMNNGHEAEQDIFHAHLHVIPRFKRGEAFVTLNHEAYEDGESAQLAEKMKTAIVG